MNGKRNTALILAGVFIALGVGMLGACTPQKSETQIKVEAQLESKKKLVFGENGQFKALVVADVHAVGTLPENVQTNIRTLVDRENPDLVIFTGDNTICSNEEQLRAALDSMVGYIEDKQIAWCHVYGNHDHEGGMSKEEMQPIFESYDYCVSKWGDTAISGVGNYVLPVYKRDGEIGSLVWCLDSGNYLSEEDKASLLPVESPDFLGMPNSPYDYIKADQIHWYYSTSLLFEEYFQKKIPSLMAFHIPLQETYYAWQNRLGLSNWTGEKNETVGASLVNSGLFYSLTERGDVKAVVNGHDHINDFMVEYKGIKLCYSPNVSTLTYHDERMMGGRVFIMDEQTPDVISTRVQYLFRTV